ncbi:MAG TPA: PAAR-like domain-containing protein [Gemmataceae bacterium]|nr:PAAR-like domain-containing protein [Gemmataceae bacterium]
MGCEVYANLNEIACKKGGNKVIAEFPDVCLSPPSPPAGPVPIPYPDTSFSKDMQNGSKTVQIKGGEVMLKDTSFYKTSPLGDEAATNSFGANVITHVITGKTYFVAWSMDVKFEGENVDRHMDMTTSNHNPKPGGTGPTNMSAGDMSTPEEMEPPGDCNPQQYERLNGNVAKGKAAVRAANNGSEACREGDSAAELRAKGEAWQQLADARAERDDKCFKGGDAGHKKARAMANDNAKRCQYMLKKGKAPRWKGPS